MKKNRYTEEQIAYALKQAEMGTAVPETFRKLGIVEKLTTTGGASMLGCCPATSSA